MSDTAQPPLKLARTPRLEPVFDFRQHLNGAMKSEGVIFGPTGRVVSKFVADMYGQWDGTQGELREHYLYSSGETADRLWQIRLQQDGRYTLKASDLLSVGGGKMFKTAACSRYRIRLGPKGYNLAVSAVDWMYLSESGTILNRSKLKKFGLTVAQLFATIRPV